MRQGMVWWRRGLLLLWLATAPAQAWEEFYGGWGVGATRPPGQEANVSTLQLFGGYRLTGLVALDPRLATMAGELGVNATDDGRYDGGWGTLVMNRRVSRNLELMGRFGIDIGDEPSLLAGIGIGQRIAHAMTVRLELQRRSRVSSLFLNLAYAPWQRR